jgi:wyosine [tRNA(Phe)-imidazoG37] synthetase (radical SAM superfamily)
LGVDLLCLNSICSFNCTYCQLGSIQVRINQRRLFVSTKKVLEDLEKSDWPKADIITFSGSGEPTLARNLGEAHSQIKLRTGKPTLLLTNGTQLDQPDLRSELQPFDRVYVKLDAATESSFRRVNRPVEGVTLEGIVEASAQFRSEYKGLLAVQMMLLFSNLDSAEDYASVLKRIQPDEVQINTPTRPYPDSWYLDSRGSHGSVGYPAKPLKLLSPSKVKEMAAEMRRVLPDLKITTVYDRKPDSPE